MNTTELLLKALPTREALEAFRATAELLGGSSSQLTIQSNVGNLTLQVQNGQLQEGEAQKLTRFVDESADRPFVVCNSIQLQSQQFNPGRSIRYHSEDSLSARIQLTNFEVSEVFKIVSILQQHFRFLSPSDLVQSFGMSSSESSAMALRELSVVDLKTQLEMLGHLLSSITTREVESRRTQTAEIEAIYRKKQQELEAEHTQRVAALEAKRLRDDEELEKRQAELNGRIAQFETHEAKYARRGLLTKLNEFLDEFKSIKLSTETDKKRRPIQYIVLAMCVPFLALAILGGLNYFTTPDYHYLIPLSTGVLGLTGTLLYYAKWNNRWFRAHADAELQSLSYKSDMLRASWIAELVSEWNSDGKTAPTDLLEVFSRNLFQGNMAAAADAEHPVDSIFGLLKRAQRLDVAKDHVTIEAKGSKD